jgi:hypothetical protein
MKFGRKSQLMRLSRIAFNSVLVIFLSCFVLGLGASVLSLTDGLSNIHSCCDSSQTVRTEGNDTIPELCSIQTFLATPENNHSCLQRPPHNDNNEGLISNAIPPHPFIEAFTFAFSLPKQRAYLTGDSCWNAPPSPPSFIVRYAVNAPPLS